MSLITIYVFFCQIDELERKCQGQQEIIFELKEQLGHAHADYKLKSAHFDGKYMSTFSFSNA